MRVGSRGGQVHDKRQAVQRLFDVETLDEGKSLIAVSSNIKNSQEHPGSPPRPILDDFIRAESGPQHKSSHYVQNPGNLWPPESRQWWWWSWTWRQGRPAEDAELDWQLWGEGESLNISRRSAQTLTWHHLNIISIICSECNAKTSIHADCFFFFY